MIKEKKISKACAQGLLAGAILFSGVAAHAEVSTTAEASTTAEVPTTTGVPTAAKASITTKELHTSPMQSVLDTMTMMEKKLQASPLYADEVKRAEATDYLFKTMAFHLDRNIISGDSDNPRLVFTPGYGAPNVDTYYLVSKLDPNGTYRIYGTLGTVNQTIFGIYTAQALDGDSGAGSRIKGDELSIEDDGSFEILVSREKQGKNWLHLSPKANSIAIYQIFGDWEQEQKGTILLERLDTNTQRSTLPKEQVFADRIAAFNEGVTKDVSVWLQILEAQMQKPSNVFAAPRIIQVASAGSYFSAAPWDLKEDQAMIIEFDDPAGSSYWSFSLYTVWGDVLDRAGRHTSLNFTQTHRDEDGKFRIILAAKDPGVANWLDIDGHPQGLVNWRVTTDTQPAAPTTKIVSLSELSSHLPAKTKMISQDERDTIIAKRKRHLNKRLAH